MNDAVYQEGVKSWYEGVGFVLNPFNLTYEEEKYNAWSRGWWSIQDQTEQSDRKELRAELDKELALDEAERERKEKKKTKNGRAELAGQNTLF